MTKLKWGRSFNGPSWPTFPEPKWLTPEEAARQRQQRADERARRYERSEQIRYRAIIRKFGLDEAVRYGVPAQLVARIKAAEARAERRRQKRAGFTSNSGEGPK